MSKNKLKRTKHVITKKSIFFSLIGLILIALITAQLYFNFVVWYTIQRQSVFEIRTLIVDAIRGLEDTKSKPEDGQKIPEAHIILPATTTEVNDLIYTYYGPPDNSDDNEIQITTKRLSRQATTTLHGSTIEEVFEKVPVAQACSRGFTVSFENSKVDQDSGSNLSLVTKKTLADGREVQIWRETECGTPNESSGTENDLYKMMDKLEEHLLEIESY